MNKTTFLVIVIFLLASAISSIGCGGDSAKDASNPEDAVNGFLQALDTEDADEAARYWVDSDYNETEREAAQQVLGMASVNISNVKMELVSQTESQATIEVSYDIQLEMEAETVEQFSEESFELLKQGNKWLIEGRTAQVDTQPETVSSWTHEGNSYSVVTVLAESDTFLDEEGLKIIFVDEAVSCGDSLLNTNRVEVLFLEGASGYSDVRKVSFYTVEGSNDQISLPSDFPGTSGDLTSIDLGAEKKAQGWVRIDERGTGQDSSISAEFEATFCEEELATVEQETSEPPVPPSPPIPPPTTTPEPVVITIGNLTAFHGLQSDTMIAIDDALTDMVTYHNEQDIIPRVELEVIRYDGQSDPSQDIPGYEWLKQKGADLIFTAIPSAATALGARAYNDEMALILLNDQDTTSGQDGLGYSIIIELEALFELIANAVETVGLEDFNSQNLFDFLRPPEPTGTPIPPPTPTPTPEPVVITIGNLTAFHGLQSDTMIAIDDALTDMVTYHNEQDIIPGVELEVIRYDGQSDPSQDMPGYEWLKQKGADLIFTAIPSTTTALEARAYNDEMALILLNDQDTTSIQDGLGYSIIIELEALFELIANAVETVGLEDFNSQNLFDFLRPPEPTGTPIPPPTPTPEPVVITIGNLTDMTGVYSNAMSVVNMALEDMVRYYNEQDLIPGVELEVIAYDGQYNPAQAIPGYEWLKQKGSDLIFVPVPATPIALKSRADADGIPVFTHHVGEEYVIPPGHMFGLSTHPQYKAFTILKWIAENDWDYETKGPAKIGGAAWSEAFSIEFLDAVEEYTTSHPEQFEFEGAYLKDFTFEWNPEIEALKDCDYIFPPTPMHHFAKLFSEAGHTTTFIGTDTHTEFMSWIDGMDLWDEIDGMLIALPNRWWNETGPIIDLTNSLLNEYHPNEADDIIRKGSGYLATYSVFAMLEIIRATVETVGPEAFNSQALYEAAESFSGTIGDLGFSFTDTKRTGLDYLGICEVRATEKTLYRVEQEWIPVVTEP